jgi:cyclopropane fatty-acyl-phospholipid synthase-like methyltransferase
MSESLTPDYFENLYTIDPDPWRFATSEYERRKYASTLAALPSGRIGAAFEIGCSIGVLTQSLAAHCDSLLAVDVAEPALAQARARCAGHDNVTIARMHIPQEWPDRAFDTILFSEVLYYLSRADLVETARLAASSLTLGGVILLVHYTKPTNYPQTGDQASENFIASTGLRPILQRREAEYRLDLLSR